MSRWTDYKTGRSPNHMPEGANMPPYNFSFSPITRQQAAYQVCGPIGLHWSKVRNDWLTETRAVYNLNMFKGFSWSCVSPSNRGREEEQTTLQRASTRRQVRFHKPPLFSFLQPSQEAWKGFEKENESNAGQLLTKMSRIHTQTKERDSESSRARWLTGGNKLRVGCRLFFTRDQILRAPEQRC